MSWPDMNRGFILVGRGLFDYYHSSWREIDRNWAHEDGHMVELLRKALRREVVTMAKRVGELDPRAFDSGAYLIPI